MLIAGGSDGSSLLQSAELFNSTTDTFTELAAAGETELHTAREGAVAAPLPDGQVLITGGNIEGSGYLQSADLYYSAPQLGRGGR